jgi:branched-chain amino acid transport system ATP-binding protein
VTPLVEAKGVSKYYGGFRALEDVSVAISEGEFVAVVGPNGAGKTTLVNLLTGLLAPTKGQVFFKGANIAGVGPVVLAQRGMARTFQLVQIFPQLTVAESIAAAVVSQQAKQWRLLSGVSTDDGIQARVAEIARIFGLEKRLGNPSRLLSQGEKKLLDVASAFALNPEVILLDEPTSGVSTAEKHGLMQTLVGAAKTAGVKAIILVEHDMDLVASYSHRIIALSEGKVLADLPPGPFFADPVIIETVVGKRRGR